MPAWVSLYLLISRSGYMYVWILDSFSYVLWESLVTDFNLRRERSEGEEERLFSFRWSLCNILSPTKGFGEEEQEKNPMGKPTPFLDPTQSFCRLVFKTDNQCRYSLSLEKSSEKAFSKRLFFFLLNPRHKKGSRFSPLKWEVGKKTHARYLVRMLIPQDILFLLTSCTPILCCLNLGLKLHPCVCILLFNSLGSQVYSSTFPLLSLTFLVIQWTEDEMKERRWTCISNSIVVLYG